jgi:hypothetical protein
MEYMNSPHASQYIPIVLPLINSREEEIPHFSFVAVKNGQAVGNIFKFENANGNLPVVYFPDYDTLLEMLSCNPEFIEHAPVPEGTEWDGEKFIIPVVERPEGEPVLIAEITHDEQDA